MIPVSLWQALVSLPESLCFNCFDKYTEDDIENTRYEIKTLGRKRFKHFIELYERIEKYQEQQELGIEVSNIE
jgi:hypothetical protein